MQDLISLCEGDAAFQSTEGVSADGAAASLLDTAVDAISFRGPVTVGDFDASAIEALGSGVSALSVELLHALQSEASQRERRFAAIGMQAGSPEDPPGFDEPGFDAAERRARMGDALDAADADSMQVEAFAESFAGHRAGSAQTSPQVHGTGGSRTALEVRDEAVMNTVVGVSVVRRRISDGEDGALTLSSTEEFVNNTDPDFEFFQLSTRECIDLGLLPRPTVPFQTATLPSGQLPLATAPAYVSERAQGKRKATSQSLASGEGSSSGNLQPSAAVQVYDRAGVFMEELRRTGFEVTDQFDNMIANVERQKRLKIDQVPGELLPVAGDSAVVVRQKDADRARWLQEARTKDKLYSLRSESVSNMVQMGRTKMMMSVTEYGNRHGTLPPPDLFIPLIIEFPFLVDELETRYNYKFDESTIAAFQLKVDEAAGSGMMFVDIRRTKVGIYDLQAKIRELAKNGEESLGREQRDMLRIARENLKSLYLLYQDQKETLLNSDLPEDVKKSDEWKQLMQEDETAGQVSEQLRALKALDASQDRVEIHELFDYGKGSKNPHLERCNELHRMWRSNRAYDADDQGRAERAWQEEYAKYKEYAEREFAAQEEAQSELGKLNAQIRKLSKQKADAEDAARLAEAALKEIEREFERECGSRKRVGAEDDLAEDSWTYGKVVEEEGALALEAPPQEVRDRRVEQIRARKLQCDALWERNMQQMDRIEQLRVDRGDIEHKLSEAQRVAGKLGSTLRYNSSKRNTSRLELSEEEYNRRKERDARSRRLLVEKGWVQGDKDAMATASIEGQRDAALEHLDELLRDFRGKVDGFKTAYAEAKRNAGPAKKRAEKERELAEKQMGAAVEAAKKLSAAQLQKLGADASTLQQNPFESEYAKRNANLATPSRDDVLSLRSELKAIRDQKDGLVQRNKERLKTWKKAEKTLQEYERKRDVYAQSQLQADLAEAKRTAANLRDKFDMRVLNGDGLVDYALWDVVRNEIKPLVDELLSISQKEVDKRPELAQAEEKMVENAKALIDAAGSAIAAASSGASAADAELSAEQRAQVVDVLLLFLEASAAQSRAADEISSVQPTGANKEKNGHKTLQDKIKLALENAAALRVLTQETLDEVFEAVYDDDKGLKVNVAKREELRRGLESRIVAAEDPDVAEAQMQRDVELKQLKRAKVNVENSKKEEEARQLMQGFDRPAFELEIKKETVAEIVRCAQNGSGRALHYYRLLCDTMRQAFDTFQNLFEKPPALDCDQPPATGNWIVFDWSRAASMKSYPGGADIADKLDYLLTQWARLPAERRCGSMPPAAELLSALDEVVPGTDGSFAVIDEYTGELMVVTSSDDFINSMLFPEAGDVPGQLSEPLAPKKRTPVAWMHIVRGGSAAHVPVDDRLHVVRARGEEAPFALHITHKEALEDFQANVGGDAAISEEAARAALLGARKWPLPSGLDYADIRVNDMNGAAYGALMEAQRQSFNYQTKNRVIRDELASLNAIETLAMQQSIEIEGSLEDALVERGATLPKSYYKDTEDDTVASLASEQAIKQLAEVRKNIEVFQNAKTEAELRFFRSRGHAEFGPLVSQGDVLEGVRATLQLESVSQLVQLVRPDVAAAPPGTGDGLESSAWQQDAEARKRFASACNRFIDAYYPWIARLQADNRNRLDQYVDWMRLLRDNGFPYLAVVTPDMPFNLVVPGTMDFGRLILGSGPAGYENSAFWESNYSVVGKQPANFAYKKTGQRADPMSDDEWFAKARVRKAAAPQVFVEQRSRLELGVVNAAVQKRKAEEGEVAQTSRVQRTEGGAGPSGLDELTQQAKMQIAHEQASQLITGSGQLADLQRNMYDPWLELEWTDVGGTQKFNNRLSQLRPDQMEGAIRALRSKPATAGKYSVALHYNTPEGHCVILRTLNDERPEGYQVVEQITSTYQIGSAISEWISNATAAQAGAVADEEMEDAGDSEDEESGESEGESEGEGEGEMDFGAALEVELSDSDDLEFDFEFDFEDEWAEARLVAEALAHAQALGAHAGCARDFDPGELRPPVARGAAIVARALDEIEF